ncbi:MAG: hypothetical protein H6R19_1690 [Proteobacteria bacterium]|nr:hypothetical protein [Pseudomonadota bacterium]
MKHTQIHLAIALLVFGAASVKAAEPVDGTNPAPLPPSSSAVPNSAEVLPANVFEAGGIPVAKTRSKNPLKVADGINVFADVVGSFGYDSNVTTATKGQEVSSSVYNLRPTVVAEAKYRADRYTLAYKGDYTRYPSFDANKLENNDLLFNGVNVFDTRASVAWGAAYMDRYDAIGSTDRSIGASKPDHHRDLAVNATFRYGADDAKGRVEVDTGLSSKRYLNNHDSTEASDVDTTNVGARFYYRVAPKTRAFVEYRWTTYDYAHDTNFLENTERRYLLGATWDATAAVSGTIKAGQQRKDFFYDQLRPEYSGFTWEAALRWKPLTYTSFDLISGRSASDPSGSTGIPIAKTVSLAWSHDWSSYVHSKLSAGYTNTRYNSDVRRDRESVYSIGMMYDLRRWLGVGLDYTFSHRNSNVDTYDYLRNLTMLRLEASF